MALISVVVPVYNEQDCLPALFDRLEALRRGSEDDYEFIFVDDGSSDGSREIIRDLSARGEHVRYVFLSRNFGHESATTAGVDHAGGDAVVLLDADLQDPPEVIPDLVARWREGCQIVYARRRHRRGEGPFKRLTAWLFYRIIRRLSDVDIPADAGDFRLMDRQVVEQFRRLREHNRFVRGLVAWTGFRQAAVPYDRQERFAGRTKYGLVKMLLLAFDAVMGFSIRPLRVGLLLGLVACLFSLGMMVVIIVQKIFWGIPVPGYALLTAGLFLLGGVQLSVLGLIGEYVGRMYRQTQQRPLYIVGEKSRALPPGAEGWYGQAPGGPEGSGSPAPAERRGG